MTQYYIVEQEEGLLPDHWPGIGRTQDERRVTNKFGSKAEAVDYIENSYGMYREDVVILSDKEVSVTLH